MRLSIFRADLCEDVLLDSVTTEVPLADADFRAPDLAAATLHTVVHAFNDATGAPVILAIDLTWTPAGDLQRWSRHAHAAIPGSSLNVAHSLQTARAAQASGTIHDGTINQLTGPMEGALDAGSFGEVSIE